MKITRRTDYAIHLIMDLSQQPDSCLGLRKLAAGHGVTYAFARTVQQGLLNAGIIQASRGINGGIKLAKPLDGITLLEVYEAAQNPLTVTFDSAGAPWCTCEQERCICEDLWDSARIIMQEYLAKITVQSLLNGNKS